MPANVSHEYFKAEERYHQARTLEERILATEELIRAAPKHKGSEKLLRTLKRRLAKLRRELQEKRERRVGRGGGPSFAIKKEGAAQVVLVGLPNSGKSKLLRDLTSAHPVIADYPFTTREPVPGMMQFEDVQVQLVETPAVVEGSSMGRGLGMQPISVARTADAIALVIDVSADPVQQIRTLVDEFMASGVKLNRTPPKIAIKRRLTGGIEIRGVGMVGGEEEIKRVLQERNIHNAIVTVEEPATIEEFEELLNESTAYVRAFVVLTKCDYPGAAQKLKLVKRQFGGRFPIIVAGDTGEGLRKTIYEKLDLIRVYTKRPDEEPASRPLVIPRGSTVFHVARSVHRDFAKGLKFARVWGSAKFPGQQVPRDYILRDKDVVELHA